MTSQPTASIVIPTRDRAGYLEVALASVVPQARAAGAEVIAINDGGDAAADQVSRRHGARVVTHDPPRGINAARNAGIDAAGADLIVLIDDDVRAPEGWLHAILAGAAAAPEIDVFGGPIRAVLEGGGPRACGGEPAPITTLELGPADRDVEIVWGANMAFRRRALQRAGRFDESMSGPGDEEEWEHRYRAAGGVIRYLAEARLEHRRQARDATLRRLIPAAYAQGRAGRVYDVRKDATPSILTELRAVLGCVWHVIRRRCALGLVMGAEAAGRLHEAIAGRGA